MLLAVTTGGTRSCRWPCCHLAMAYHEQQHFSHYESHVTPVLILRLSSCQHQRHARTMPHDLRVVNVPQFHFPVEETGTNDSLNYRKFTAPKTMTLTRKRFTSSEIRSVVWRIWLTVDWVKRTSLLRWIQAAAASSAASLSCSSFTVPYHVYYLLLAPWLGGMLW